MYTRLGENLEDLDAAEEVADHYIEAIDKIVAAGIDGEVSVKPTQLGLDHDADTCLAHLVRIAEHAAANGSYLWIDMEGSDYVELDDRPLRAAARGPAADRHLPPGVPAPDGGRLRAASAAGPGHPPGQGRLRREGGDRLHGTAAASIRTTSGSRSGSCSTAADDRSGSASGTHDVALIEQIAEQVGPAGIERTAFEVEMLYGIRTDEQYRLAKAGYRVQALIAYGEHWYPWYMRRLAERPANVWFALRQMLP